MAMRNLEVVVTVVDKATKQLDNVGRKVRHAGQEARKSSVDFTKLNRTIFSTTAFVGTFVKAFQVLTNSLDQGSQLDRLERQYERVLGPKGALFESISKTTDASIDKMEALRQGISLANLGIVSSTDQVASLISKAGVAAKLAGKDSADGIKQYSDFLKDGNVSHLQFLNLIAQSNPALQAQMAILGKAGGMMGQVVSTQARLAMGQALLNAATSGNLKGFRDLRDVVLDVKQNFTFLRQETGILLGKALSPLLEKLNDFIVGMTKTIEHIRKNEKNLVFMTKALVLTTGAAVGLAGALGTLRLATIALGSIGFGVPRLTLMILTLGSAFLGITKPVDSLMEKFKLVSAFIRGIFQLVTNLDPETGFSKMDKSIHDLLKKHGLLELAQNIARFVSVVKTAVTDVIAGFKFLATSLDNMFGGMVSSTIKFLANFNEPWSKWWVSDAITPVQKFARAVSLILGGLFAVFAGKKLFGALGGILGKIPVIGRLFGGGGMGKGPKGTVNDPIYTVQAGAAIAGGLGSLLSKGAGPFKTLFDLLRQGFKIGGLKQVIKDIPAAISLAFPKLARIFSVAFGLFGRVAGFLIKGLSFVAGKLVSGFLSVVTSFLIRMPMALMSAFSAAAPVFAGLAAAAIGVAVGSLINLALDKFTTGKTAEGFEGNIVEQGIFKLDKLLGGKLSGRIMASEQSLANAGSVESLNAHRAKMGQLPLTQEQLSKIGSTQTQGSTPFSRQNMTSIATPKSAEDRMEMSDALGEQLKSIQSSDRLEQQKVFEAALNSGENMNKFLTKSEAYDAFFSALQDSTHLSTIASSVNNRSSQVNPMNKRMSTPLGVKP